MGGSDKPDLKAEFSNMNHARGTCSMARSQNPNSANSQFFICFDDAAFLNRQYTVWGQVIEGMDNVDKIKRGEPVQDPDKIVSMKVAADVRSDADWQPRSLWPLLGIAGRRLHRRAGADQCAARRAASACRWRPRRSRSLSGAIVLGVVTAGDTVAGDLADWRGAGALAVRRRQAARATPT